MILFIRHIDFASWDQIFKLLDMHLLDIAVKHHCNLVQYNLLDSPEIFQISKTLTTDSNAIIYDHDDGKRDHEQHTETECPAQKQQRKRHESKWQQRFQQAWQVFW